MRIGRRPRKRRIHNPKQKANPLIDVKKFNIDDVRQEDYGYTVISNGSFIPFDNIQTTVNICEGKEKFLILYIK